MNELGVINLGQHELPCIVQLGHHRCQRSTLRLSSSQMGEYFKIKSVQGQTTGNKAR